MKILFDHQIFTIQKYGGASKYFCELLKNIPRKEWDTTTFISNNEYIKNTGLFPYYNFIPNHYFRGKARLMDGLNMPYSIFKVKQGSYDIFHQTHFTNNYLSGVGKKKMVVTFHDMNHSKFSNLYTKNASVNPLAIEVLQKKSIERADMVISVSENTKKDLVEQWNINPEKIRVIHHGIINNRIPDLNPNRFTAYPYILYVGERFEYKNYHRFIKAFQIVNKRIPDLRLVCTGKKFTKEENDELNELHILDKVLQIAADERTMARLYQDAEIFVYPSIYEGFGMPILEAMLYECPVVLSNTSSLPEVAGNAGTYFDPYQEEDIAEKIEKMLLSKSKRGEKIALGNERIKQFTWEKTASEHLALYKKLL